MQTNALNAPQSSSLSSMMNWPFRPQST